MFAAFAPEGDLGGHKTILSGLCDRSEYRWSSEHPEESNQYSIDDFFRKSGGLKAELTAIFKSCGERNLIYEDALRTLKGRVAMIERVLDLDNDLDALGKQTARTDVKHSLEKMRTARKAEISGLVPKLKEQVRRLAQIACVPQSAREEMETTADALQTFEDIVGKR